MYVQYRLYYPLKFMQYIQSSTYCSSSTQSFVLDFRCSLWDVSALSLNNPIILWLWCVGLKSLIGDQRQISSYKDVVFASQSMFIGDSLTYPKLENKPRASRWLYLPLLMLISRVLLIALKRWFRALDCWSWALQQSVMFSEPLWENTGERWAS